jgi:hypothetical protein
MGPGSFYQCAIAWPLVERADFRSTPLVEDDVLAKTDSFDVQVVEGTELLH